MITSTSNKNIRQIQDLLAKSKTRRETGLFVAEGRKMFLEAPIEKISAVFVMESYEKKITTLDKKPEDGSDISLDYAVADKLKQLSKNYETVSDEVFRKMSDTQTPQGILCMVVQKNSKLSEILGDGVYLFLEDLQDPGNLGTIIRTAEAAGVKGIIATKGCVDRYNPKVVRSTMGPIYRVPFCTVDNTSEAVETMKAAGIKLYAAHLKGQKNYTDIKYDGNVAFMIGNEGNGLKKETAALADEYLLIPMEGEVESLNASVAAALLMYEAKRQRDE